MEFSVVTEYNYKRRVRFTDYYSTHRVILWVLIGIFALYGIYWIRDMILNGVWLYYNLFPLIYCLFFIILLVFSYFILPRIRLRKSDANNLTCTLTFNEDAFVMVTDSPLVQENSRISYEQIYKVAEGKEDMYIFLTKRNALIVDKSGFVQGDESKLKAFLSTKLDKKKIRFK
ncbi:MAG: YcxB family protein [Ruminococcus sp.]|nr:YcxB family protein [Ruminococcus sp.]